jgi:hypothetical protein
LTEKSSGAGVKYSAIITYENPKGTKTPLKDLQLAPSSTESLFGRIYGYSSEFPMEVSPCKEHIEVHQGDKILESLNFKIIAEPYKDSFVMRCHVEPTYK